MPARSVKHSSPHCSSRGAPNACLTAEMCIRDRFFGVAFYSLLSGLILIVMRRRIFSHMVGFLVIENGVFLFSTAIGVEMPLLINFAILLDILDVYKRQ